MQLSSEKQRILVFSDPHQEIDRVEYLLKKEEYDFAVCLGDWFDSFTHNSKFHAEEVCRFLKEWIHKKNFVTCIGNHDIQYLYENKTTICSGYNIEKKELITEILGADLSLIRSKFLWYLWIDDYLCSHAGIHPIFLKPNQEINKEAITWWLDEQIEFAQLPLNNGGRHWLYGAGQGRGGNLRAGGITWNCFDSEFQPIEGLKQIVGHTSHRKILNHYLDGNINLAESNDLDIDCHLNEYVIIQNGKLTIKKFSEL